MRRYLLATILILGLFHDGLADPPATAIGSHAYSQPTPTLDLQNEIAGGWLPDPKLTPGDTFPNVTADILSQPGYTKSVRDVPESERERVFSEYGVIHHASGEYEVDHLIPLELGGSNDIKNLWPEPYHGAWNAHVKDRLEDKLHSMVADHQIALGEAQKEIAADWITAYKRYVVGERVDLTAAVTFPATPLAAPTSQPDQPVGKVTFVSVQGARPGGHASVTVQTAPNSNCSIVYRTPAGTKSKAAGLTDKTTDVDGKVSWTWLIGGSTKAGTGSVTVTCGGEHATTGIDIP
jgi:hypothetical protein